MNAKTDSELLLLITAGDKLAFKELHSRYWKHIFYTSTGFLKSPQWAQDVVQDVFLKLWVKREKLTRVTDIRAYLFITARNELINAIKRSVRRETFDKKYGPTLSNSFLLPDQRIDAKQLELLVDEAISRLSRQQREIYILTREHGLSHKQIAIRLGLAPKTVANIITRTLTEIRQHIHLNGERITTSAIFTWRGSAARP